jgi:hypothetical protein
MMGENTHISMKVQKTSRSGDIDFDKEYN